jgi:hypothetical protein
VWIAICCVDRADPSSRRTLGGLLLGLIGVAVLVRFDRGTDSRSLLIGSVAILIGAASWAAGVVYGQRVALPRDAMLRTATTLLCGAALLSRHRQRLASSRTCRTIDSCARVTRVSGRVRVDRGVLAYYWLLDRFPATLVATHTYVNPAVRWCSAGRSAANRSASLIVGLVIVTSAIAWSAQASIGQRARRSG